MGAESFSVGAEIFRFDGQAAIVVIGWTVVHRRSVERDRDKARREMLAKSADALGTIAGTLLISARDYHMTARSINTEIVIKMVLQDLTLQTGSLNDICSDAGELAACRSSVLALKKAVTGRHFEDEHIQPITDTTEQLQDIAGTVLRVKQCFLKLKHRQFPVK